MASVLPPMAAPLIEPIPIAEEFVSGPAFLRTIGGEAYLVFYVDQIHPPDSGMAQERRISHRLWMPAKQLVVLRAMIDAQEAPAWYARLLEPHH